MVIAPFNYLAPKSLQEACKIIDEHDGEAKVLAGGQSLLPLLKLNLVQVSYLVDLKGSRASLSSAWRRTNPRTTRMPSSSAP